MARQGTVTPSPGGSGAEDARSSCSHCPKNFGHFRFWEAGCRLAAVIKERGSFQAPLPRAGLETRKVFTHKAKYFCVRYVTQNGVDSDFIPPKGGITDQQNRPKCAMAACLSSINFIEMRKIPPRNYPRFGRLQPRSMGGGRHRTRFRSCEEAERKAPPQPRRGPSGGYGVGARILP